MCGVNILYNTIHHCQGRILHPTPPSNICLTDRCGNSISGNDGVGIDATLLAAKETIKIATISSCDGVANGDDGGTATYDKDNPTPVIMIFTVIFIVRFQVKQQHHYQYTTTKAATATSETNELKNRKNKNEQTNAQSHSYSNSHTCYDMPTMLYSASEF